MAAPVCSHHSQRWVRSLLDTESCRLTLRCSSGSPVRRDERTPHNRCWLLAKCFSSKLCERKFSIFLGLHFA